MSVIHLLNQLLQGQRNMKKVIFFGIIATVILCQNQVSAKNEHVTSKEREKRAIHVLPAIVNTGSAFLTIKDYIKNFIDLGTFDSSSWQEVDRSLKNFEKNWMHHYQLTINDIKELPYFLAFLQQESNFRKRLFSIHESLRITARTKKQIDGGFLKEDPVAKEKFIKDFFHSKFTEVEENIFEIRRTFLDTDTTGFMTNDINEARKKFLTVCSSKRSEALVLDSLLRQIQVAHVEYFYTKKFLLLMLRKVETFDLPALMNNLEKSIDLDYKRILEVFRKEMAYASQLFWTCDARLYKGDDRKKYYPEYNELEQFSKYLLSTHDYAKPVCSDNRKPEKCHGYNTTQTEKVSICPATRRCKIEFLSCTNLKAPDTSSQLARVCLNENKNARFRYYGIDLYGKDSAAFTCPSGIKEEIKYDWNNAYCDCLCHENKYNFRAAAELSDFGNNKVITGARLKVANNTVYIEIQQGQTSGNQTIIGEATWKRTSGQVQDNVIKNEKGHGLRSVDLTEIKDLDHGEFIVGLLFYSSHDTGRVKLVALTKSWNYTTGRFNEGIPRHRVPDDAIKEHNLQDRDVPTRAPGMNEPISENNEYVSFTTTSLLKDGGQTTIPYIDTQDVATVSPVTPISGIGLYLRGQPGFGGFIALKLYTYDINAWYDANQDKVSISSHGVPHV